MAFASRFRSHHGSHHVLAIQRGFGHISSRQKAVYVYVVKHYYFVVVVLLLLLLLLSTNY